MMFVSARSSITAVIWSVLVAGGCDLFNTREPEQPSNTSSNFLPPTSADVVLVNFQNAIEEKHKENYLRCFVDTSISKRVYAFLPNAEAAANHQGAFDGWNLAEEVSYYKNLVESRAGGLANLEFTDARSTLVPPDEVLFTTKYYLIMQHRQNGIGQEARGRMELSIARDQQGTWSIYRWVDYRDTSDVTWSDFKAVFR